MHSRVWPSTVQVTVVLPRPTAVTVPSPEMVATEVLPMCQVGVEEVPDTFSWYFSPAFCRVKSVRLRLREPVLELELEPLPGLAKLHRTVQVWSRCPGWRSCTGRCRSGWSRPPWWR